MPLAHAARTMIDQLASLPMLFPEADTAMTPFAADLDRSLAAR